MELSKEIMDHVLLCQSNQRKRVLLGKAIQTGIDVIEVDLDKLKYKKHPLPSFDASCLPIVIFPPF